jgi:5-methylcytosine-specific restriction endonuclease McrA
MSPSFDAFSLPPAEFNPRYISAELKRQIWKRDHGRCQFKSPDGKLCGSQFALQIDHILPVAWNGQTVLNNLQLLCRTHNQFKALMQLGPSVMERHQKHS